MKLGVLKLGARIVFGETMGTSGGSGEAAMIISMLSKSNAFSEIKCFTKILKSDSPCDLDKVTCHDIKNEFTSILECDKIIVINGSVNFFGGAEDEYQILNYKAINKFDKEVIYVYCDPNLPLTNIWPSIESKPWSNKYLKEDILISKDIKVITQVHNTQKVKELFKSRGFNTEVYHYPLYMFPMMQERQPFTEKSVDIIYGGTFRGGRRKNKLTSFYFGFPENMVVELFGKIKESDFEEKVLRNPIFSGPVKYDDMLKKMSTGKAHIVIGDNQYPKFEMISQRIYESIMSNCITFIDKEFDFNKRVFGNTKLGDFLYVSSKEDVIKKMQKLTKDDIRHICELQYQHIGFNLHKYVSEFAKLIEE